MRRMALAVVLLGLGGCGGDGDPLSSVLPAGTRCVVTGEGPKATLPDVPLVPTDGGKGGLLAPGTMVRVGSDPAAKGGEANWKRPIAVVVETGELKGAAGHVTRTFLRPAK